VKRSPLRAWCAPLLLLAGSVTFQGPACRPEAPAEAPVAFRATDGTIYTDRLFAGLLRLEQSPWPLTPAQARTCLGVLDYLDAKLKRNQAYDDALARLLTPAQRRTIEARAAGLDASTLHEAVNPEALWGMVDTLEGIAGTPRPAAPLEAPPGTVVEGRPLGVSRMTSFVVAFPTLQADPGLAVGPDQARALLPWVYSYAALKDTKTQAKADILGVLTADQQAWIDANVPGTGVRDMTMLAREVRALAETRASGDLHWMAADLVAVEEGAVRVVGPFGEERLPLEAGAAAALATRPLPAGITLQLACRPEGDALTAVRVSPQNGLPIRFGRVVEEDASRVVLESPFGRETFLRNRWSDVPADGGPGAWVGLKHYDAGGVRAVLNYRPGPGRPEERGVVREVHGDRVVLATLKGMREVRVGGAPPAEGQAVVVTRPAGADAARVEPAEEPFLFTGKLSAPVREGRATFVDAWGGRLGDVAFRLASEDVLPRDLAPGDLADVRYRLSGPDGPVAVQVSERALSPVYFGEITAIDDERVELVTMQGQRHALRITTDTLRPHPVRAGDRADVGYDPGADPPVATLIVRE